MLSQRELNKLLNVARYEWGGFVREKDIKRLLERIALSEGITEDMVADLTQVLERAYPCVRFGEDWERIYVLDPSISVGELFREIY